MKITITTLGTRGDVQPYIALGLGLKMAGHQVTIGADQSFENFITSYSLAFEPINADPREALEEVDPGIQKNPLKYFNWVKRQYKKVINEAFPQTITACEGADLVIFSSLSIASGHVAEVLNIPALGAFLQPATPSKFSPSILSKPLPNFLPFQGFYNYISSIFESRLFFRMLYKIINQARKDFLKAKALPWKVFANFTTSEAQIFYGFSPSVFPKPKDWGQHIHLEGYWFLDRNEDWQADEKLINFLEKGPKPVYIGFGSMMDKDSKALTELVVEAINLSGKRAILLGGWSDLGGFSLNENILCVNDIPHDWLFPQMAAVVHHGGAGTTAAGLKFGIPTVIVPFLADQPFWGRIVYELGVGPKPIPRKTLTTEKLARAILIATTDKNIKQRAIELGDRIQAEDGVVEAVKIIEELMLNPQKMIDVYHDHIQKFS